MKYSWKKVILQCEKKRKSYWWCYSGLYCLLVIICFGHFWFNGKSLVWSGDGIAQHYKALLYFSKWMRAIIRNILHNHMLEVPTFSMSFGLGSDLFTTLQYYAIGDPFNLLSVLVPSRFMVYYYEFMVLLRLYLAGVAFSLYARYMGKEDKAVLAGSITYVFCAFSLQTAAAHVYFINPMIFLPLLFLGVEKIRREQKPVLLVAAVMLSAVSNFYFFYMLVLFVVCYVLLETVIPWEKGTFKKKVVIVLQVAMYSWGGMSKCTIFSPCCIAVFVGCTF